MSQSMKQKRERVLKYWKDELAAKVGKGNKSFAQREPYIREQIRILEEKLGISKGV